MSASKKQKTDDAALAVIIICQDGDCSFPREELYHLSDRYAALHDCKLSADVLALPRCRREDIQLLKQMFVNTMQGGHKFEDTEHPLNPEQFLAVLGALRDLQIVGSVAHNLYKGKLLPTFFCASPVTALWWMVAHICTEKRPALLARLKSEGDLSLLDIVLDLLASGCEKLSPVEQTEREVAAVLRQFLVDVKEVPATLRQEYIVLIVVEAAQMFNPLYGDKGPAWVRPVVALLLKGHFITPDACDIILQGYTTRVPFVKFVRSLQNPSGSANSGN